MSPPERGPKDKVFLKRRKDHFLIFVLISAKWLLRNELSQKETKKTKLNELGQNKTKAIMKFVRIGLTKTLLNVRYKMQTTKKT